MQSLLLRWCTYIFTFIGNFFAQLTWPIKHYKLNLCSKSNFIYKDTPKLSYQNSLNKFLEEKVAILR